MVPLRPAGPWGGWGIGWRPLVGSCPLSRSLARGKEREGMRKRMIVEGIAVASAVLFAATAAMAAPGGPQWLSAGGDIKNTRSQPSESKLTVGNVGNLAMKWQ